MQLRTFEQWIAADHTTRRNALSSVIADIGDRDRDIHAWVQVQPQPVIGDGPLAHIPFGVKDVIETANLATEYGSPVYKGRQGTTDAHIVRRLRELGGLLLGKTQAAAFACRTPPPTRNPIRPAHTPGGSSSGSAAAVAAGMVPFTVGTQTHGSVIRPASYCGVTGFKPTYDLLSTDGVLPVARSLDTLGFYTHTASGMRQLWDAMGEPASAGAATVLGIPDPPLDVDASMAQAFDATVARLRSRFDVHRVPIGGLLAEMPARNRIVEFYEGARVHEARYREFGDRLLDVADMVRDGLQIPRADYDAAMAYIEQCRAAVAEHFTATPVIVTPAATGPAPHGLESTGDARMNSPWTALGTPAIAIPMRVAPAALPLGLQLCAARGRDDELLATAQSVAAVIGDP